MADDVKNLFGGFDAVIDQFIPSGKKKSDEDEFPEVDPDDIKRVMESLDINHKDDERQDDDSKQVPAKKVVKEEPTIKPKKVDKIVEKKKPDEEEEEEVEEPTVPKKKSDVKEEEETDEIDIEEKELVGAFSDLFADELGFKYEDDEKPENIKDLVKYMQDVIDKNSIPDYASNEIKELDEFVKQGGRLSDFYKAVYRTDIDTENIDLTKEHNQKAIVRENLHNRGYSEQRIEKFISRYEESDSLEDEAKDSLEEVKEFKEKTRKELLEAQKNRQETEVQEQLNFIRNVEKIAKDMDNVMGIPLSDKDKKETLEYMLKPDRDGLTKYQKDYSSDLKNLFVSAYFTKNKNTLVNNIQKKATSDAVKNLKLKLRSQGKSTKNTTSDMDTDGGKVAQLWEIASKELKSF